MSNFNLDHINDMQFDVLKEIGNIGSGNAATALSVLIHDRVNMQEPKIELANIEMLPDIVGGAEKIMVGILITLAGDINGMMMFMMDEESANRLSLILLNEINMNASTFTDMEQSALCEVGNIIAGAYLSSLSMLTNIKIEQSIPYLSIDMAGAILSVPAIEFGKMGDKALLIESKFWRNQSDVNGYFILIPTMDSYDKIMTSLGL